MNRVGAVSLLRVGLVAALLALPAAQSSALEALDGRIQAHGFFESQLRVISDDFSGDYDLAQWHQVLNVEVNKTVGSNGVIQGGETALTMVKLPVTARYISLFDDTNQEVNDDPGPDPVTFATQVDATSSTFSHTIGGSAVTVNADDDYLFFATVFTQSDGTNDNQDRIMPLHGWQIDGLGGADRRVLSRGAAGRQLLERDALQPVVAAQPPPLPLQQHRDPAARLRRRRRLPRGAGSAECLDH